jgi:hypothetical protein
MDRSHLGLIRDVEVSLAARPEKTVTIRLLSRADPHLEVWYVRSEAANFQEVYGLPLQIEVRPGNNGASADHVDPFRSPAERLTPAQTGARQT